MRCVIDASVSLAWCMPDESHDLAERLFEDPDGAFLVPSIWLYEVANALAMRRRRNLLDDASAAAVGTLLRQLPITVHPVELRDLLTHVTATAVAHQLTVYDSSYLYLALRERLPLATVDKGLRAAATATGCELFA